VVVNDYWPVADIGIFPFGGTASDLVVRSVLERVSDAVELLQARRRRCLESGGEPFESGHANVLRMIRIGLYRLLTSCAAGVDAPQRRMNAADVATDIT
jgi:hypothetical protein